VNKFHRGRQNDSLQGKYCVNDQIRSSNIYVIDHEGNNLGLTPKVTALSIAEREGLDLVQVGEKEALPVVKIMDFGKFLYAKKKQLHDARKQQKVTQLKEVKMRPNIGDQDFDTKMRHAVEFFASGKKVKFTLQFRGRQIGMMRKLGPEFFDRITQRLRDEEVGALVEEKEQRGNSYWSKIYFIKTK